MSLDPYPDIALPANSGPTLSRPVLLQWATVRTALGQIAFGAMLMAIGWLMASVLAHFYGTIFGNALGPAGGGRGNDALSEVAAIVLGLLMVLGVGMVVVGFLTCCGAPSGFGTHGWIVAAVLAMVVFLGLLVHGFFMTRLNIQEGMNQPRRFDAQRGAMVPAAPPQARPNSFGELAQKSAPYLLRAAALLTGVFFLLFLRQTALISGKNQQHVHAIVFLAVYFTCTLSLALIDIMDVRMPAPGPQYVPFILVGLAAVTTWFAILVSCVRAVLNCMMLEA
jgi:hypothetical protein